MISYLIEMLGLPNFAHITVSAIKFESRDKTCLVRSWTNYEVITLFQKSFILRSPSVAIFPEFIKIVTIFIKTIFENSRKVKRIRNYVSKYNLYFYFLI